MRFGVGRVTPFGATTSGSLKSELAKGRLGVQFVVAMVTVLRLLLQTAWKAWKPQTNRCLIILLIANWLDNNIFGRVVGYVHFSQTAIELER